VSVEEGWVGAALRAVPRRRVGREEVMVGISGESVYLTDRKGDAEQQG
jgi:hypothetical protein